MAPIRNIDEPAGVVQVHSVCHKLDQMADVVRVGSPQNDVLQNAEC